MLKGQNFRYSWLITATPLINSKRDILGLIGLLWKDSFLHMLSPAQQQEVSDIAYNVFEHLYPPMDLRNLMCLEMRKVRLRLDDTADDDLQSLRAMFGRILSCVQLRRSFGTVLKNTNGQDVRIGSDIPTYQIVTHDLAQETRAAAE